MVDDNFINLLIQFKIMKKKLGIWGFLSPFVKSQTGRIMRLTFLFLLAGLLQVTASSFGQNTKLNLDLQNVAVREVMQAIENQSKYRFAYSSEFIDLDRKVALSLQNQSIDNTLKALFEGSGITYQVSDRLIMLYGKTDRLNAQQQKVTIEGQVTDASGESLPGVTVAVKGTVQGTITDQDGNYSLNNVPGDGTLVFSFVGMRAQEVSVAGQTVINVLLEEEMVGVDEVIVVGYSVQKKSTLTGAVSPVNVDDMSKRRVADLSQALQGQVAGVQVSRLPAPLPPEINIRIRGEGTIGNNNPLYIVDGVPTRELSFLNPADIQSMTVLKDASAAAIYGSRASAGVIIITTKSGVKGRSVFDVNYFRGVQNAVNLPNLLNTEQYMNVVEKAWNNAGYGGTNPYTADKGRADFANTDWLDEVFEPGYSQNIQLQPTGGNKNCNT